MFQLISILTDKSTNNIGDAFAADGPCSQHKKRRNSLATTQGTRKFFDPTCDEDGFYAKKQCHSGYCWCSDPDGNLIAASKKKGDVDCGMFILLQIIKVHAFY